MARVPTPEEALERARRAQEQRLKAIQSLADARQRIVDVREETERERAELETRIAGRISDAERGDVRAYNAALTAGWSATELRKIGFPEPEKKKRAARARRRTTTATETNGTTSQPATENSTHITGGTDHEPVTS
ncbi:hypothetical protein SAMN05216184_1194 [Georgenia satyanarayanai]|uniref:Uncharacterized protein n=1 Tax=Georgenia satyanarayanai TaxID=860221 RepID=A0A2Y9AWF3_9MICO|nr:hypothetical protein [Georgenia satyanarayanai]PYF96344.1 hypothetical protein A8987_1194 [Georgenia satyanarayanai]SSA46867.1 hypothetical protein SAMN05216184_1194 [Georgenia satyanarayanai]